MLSSTFPRIIRNLQKKSKKYLKNIQTFFPENLRLAHIAEKELSFRSKSLMEIKRNFEKLTVTKRRFVIRQTPSVEQTICADCGEPMLPIAQAAVLFRLKQSRIFQIVETGAAHFNEAEAGALMICLNSLAAALNSES